MNKSRFLNPDVQKRFAGQFAQRLLREFRTPGGSSASLAIRHVTGDCRFAYQVTANFLVPLLLDDLDFVVNVFFDAGHVFVFNRLHTFVFVGPAARKYPHPNYRSFHAWGYG